MSDPVLQTGVAEAAVNNLMNLDRARLNALASFASADIAAINTTETFEEFEHPALLSYAVILATRMPDPVIKPGGELDRESGVRVGEFAIATPRHPGHWAVRSGAPFETMKLLIPEHVVREKAEAAFGERAANAELLDVHKGRDPLVVATLRAITAELEVGDGGSQLFLESAPRPSPGTCLDTTRP
ncbi:MAG: hypothetical protein ACFB6S_09050 [Geminicoccaceae bacterium]